MSASGRAKEIFLDALELDELERSRFVADRCGGDDELRSRVEVLLAAEQERITMLGTRGVFSKLPRPDESASELEPGEVVGPYVLGRRLGEGGFGIVYLATQSEPVRRQVALKIVKLGMDTKAVIARFEVERQALALMEHPNIARVLDAGSTGAGRPFFAMEYVDGIPITKYCEREALGLAKRLELFRSVCLAVQHAHQRGILHRDLKPSNVMVATIDGRPEPKVIDFGIAKATGAQLTEATALTQAGFLLGTPSYMSPEQAEGAVDIDTRADVYSLGVMLYEILSGSPPFDSQELGLAGIFHAIREKEPESPSTRRARRLKTGEVRADAKRIVNVPRELDWIVMRCLEKERGRRYATAHDLAADLSRFLANEPLEAAPPGALYRLRKIVRRHRTASVAVAGLALTLIVGTVGTTLGLVRAERINVELEDANGQLDRALAENQTANRRLDSALRAAEVANERLGGALSDAEQANQELGVALTEARRQTAITEAVNAFLTEDLLPAARPGVAAGGPDTPIVVLLDRASEQLGASTTNGGRFGDEPLVEAALCHTLGVTYETLGLFDRAAKHMARCVELRAEVLGTADERTLEAQSYLGKIEKRAGRFDDAASAQREAFQGLRDRNGLADYETLAAAARLASVLREIGKSKESFELLLETVPIARETFGERAGVTTDLCSRLAVAYTDRGRFEEAEELFRLVLDAQRELLGPENPVVLNAQVNLATLLRAIRKPAEAEPLYRAAIEVQERIEGPTHPNTLNSLYNLAECLFDQRRSDEALRMLASCIPDAQKSFGPDHPRTYMWRTLEAKATDQAGEVDAAIDLMRDAHEDCRRAHGGENLATLGIQTELALLLARRGDILEAEELQVEVVDQYERIRGNTDPVTVAARVRLDAIRAER